jgi:uncharacterized protein
MTGHPGLIAVVGLALALGGASGRLWGAPVAEAAAPPPFNVKEHYTKYEYRVPMRDGVKLFTSVYLPKDTSTAHPFLINRTPYAVSPYGPDEYTDTLSNYDSLVRSGYIFVLQDVRGRGMSEGTFTDATPHRAEKHAATDVDESTDTYDTVEWLLHHVPNNNGRAGIWGVSYLGFYTSAGIIDSHPAIKAASPQAPLADFYLNDDLYHGGAFMLMHSFEFLTSFEPQDGPTLPESQPAPDFGSQDGYEFFLQLGPLSNAARYFTGRSRYWDADLKHTTYDDYWKSRAIWRHLNNVHCPVLVVGGWFDAEDLMGTLRTHQTIGDNNPGIYDGLVMGPWFHNGWATFDGRRIGSVDFAANTAAFYREHMLFPFFEQHLKGRADAKLPAAYVFETGTNVWRQYSAWPPRGARPQRLYFIENGGLSFKPPGGAEAASDTYVSDPAKPVPYIGYTAFGMPREYMVSDQRFAAGRPDVLVYTTPPLEGDVTLAGPISARLFVSTTGTDSDWVVKLIDVYPAGRSNVPESTNDMPASGGLHPGDVWPPSVVLAGYQQLVRGEPFRGKFRHGFEHPVPFIPGQVEAVTFSMPDINHTFRRGHRIMVQVQSSWFPLIDRNPQSFVDIPTAKPEDFQAATQRVFRSTLRPSSLEVQMLTEATQ